MEHKIDKSLSMYMHITVFNKILDVRSDTKIWPIQVLKLNFMILQELSLTSSEQGVIQLCPF